MKKMRLIFTKTNNGHNFQLTKFSVVDFFLTDRSNLFRLGRQIFQLSIFLLSREKCDYQSHWVRNFRFFSLPYFVFLGILNVISVSHTNFQWVSSHNLRKFDKQPWIEYDEGFAANLSTRQSGAKGEWRVSSWLMISIMWKVIYFWSVFWRLFSGVEILV